MSDPSSEAALPDGVLGLIPGFLGRQRWFSGDGAPHPSSVSVAAADQLAVTNEGSHRLLWAVVTVGAAPAGAAAARGGPRPRPPGEADAGEPPASSSRKGRSAEAANVETPALSAPTGPEAAAGEGAAARGEAPPAVRYQLLIGERPNGEPAEFLNGHEPSVLGSVGDRYYYDATVDAEMALAWLAVITSGAVAAQRVRPVNAEQSNTSLVYDNRLIAKVFRRLPEGPNPDIEVTEALAGVHFEHVARPVAVWRKDGTDLAFVQEFLVGGTEGWALAVTSLRDLYSSRPAEASDAGGDFAHEAARLGRMTAEMHRAMAEAFGVDRDRLRRAGWAAVIAEIEQRLREVLGGAYSGSAQTLVEHLRAVADPGPAIRVHGDFHLGQVMRTDAGWFVLDFEGEPVRGLEERQAFTSPFKDVSGMLRSFQYAAHFALLEREQHEQAELAYLADGWEQRNREAFLDGYFATSGVTDLLPRRPDDRASVALAFELQKALYELAYEQAYRPGWVAIPTAAIQRILAGSHHGTDG